MKFFVPTYLILILTIIVSCDSQTSNDEETAEKAKPVTPKPVKADLGPQDDIQLTDSEKQHYLDQGIDIKHRIPTGLKVGNMAPVFKQKNQYGDDVFLPDLYKEGPVVMLFYRGQWCPVCSRYLTAFQDSLSMIAEKGAQVLIVTPETAANVQRTIEKTGIKTNIISDPNGLLMNAFRVSFHVTEDYQKKIKNKLDTDIAKNNGAQEAKLPVPASYIIDSKGKVRWMHFDVDYRNRAAVADILQALDNLPQ